jgi:hypothetical protein
MFTFEWDDLQPRKDQHLLYFQGLAGCKLQNRVSLKPFNPGRGAVTHGLPVPWCISGSVLMMLRSTQRNIMENLNIGGGMTGALGNRGNQTRARSSAEKGLEGRHLPPSLPPPALPEFRSFHLGDRDNSAPLHPHASHRKWEPLCTGDGVAQVQDSQWPSGGWLIWNACSLHPINKPSAT